MKKQLFVHDDSRVQYWTYHEDKKPTIVMIHGFRGTHHGLEKIVQALPEFRCIVPDLPGFGASEAFANGEHSLDNYVEFIHDFMQSIGSPVALLGHSFGSIVTSHYAARYPDEVQKLILINPISAPALKGPKAVMTKAALMYYWLAKKSPKQVSRKILSHKAIVDLMSHQMTISKDPELRAFVRAQHREHFSTFASPEVVSQAFRASVSNTVKDVVRHLIMPTLVVGADKDQVSAVETQRDLTRALPVGKYVELKNVGHLTHYERPREVAEAIRKFLSE